MVIKCPECGTENKVPDPSKIYRCGKCNAILVPLKDEKTNGEKD
jgi:DNA-directed RNA polymerase subunit RPC12/RpoP